MVLAKPKYKVCKRLGSGVYEKCQTQRFALSEARKKRSFGGRRRTVSDYGRQLIEKQKVRFAYGITEKQLSRYVREAMGTADPVATLFAALELRLDNVVYRAGFAPTRRAARQMVNHGHIVVGDRKNNIPSHALKKGDTFAAREGSAQKQLFALREKEIAAHTAPAWLSVDAKKLTGTVKGVPTVAPGETSFDFAAVFEFYSR